MVYILHLCDDFHSISVYSDFISIEGDFHFCLILQLASPGRGQNGKLHWIAVDQLVTKYAFQTSLKAPSSPNCVNLLPAVHAKTDKRWQSSFEYFASHPSLLHWFTYLINMPPTVCFLHLAVVSIEASVRPANEFCLLFRAVLIAKPETIESINCAFSPLNHVVYNPLHPVPSSFHNPYIFKWSFTKAGRNGVQKWILAVAKDPHWCTRPVLNSDAKWQRLCETPGRDGGIKW